MKPEEEMGMKPAILRKMLVLEIKILILETPEIILLERQETTIPIQGRKMRGKVIHASTNLQTTFARVEM
jgi:hypothetical protein